MQLSRADIREMRTANVATSATTRSGPKPVADASPITLFRETFRCTADDDSVLE